MCCMPKLFSNVLEGLLDVKQIFILYAFLWVLQFKGISTSTVSENVLTLKF
jgi:hypothetical protein